MFGSMLAKVGAHSVTRRSATVEDTGASKAELVLIVDDDKDLRTAVRTVLANAGYRTAEANDGQEALALMQAEDKPALLLLDLMMPNMDGWQLRSRLRSDPGLGAIPIVIMTAHAGVLRAVSNVRPETPVLSKPLDVERLLQVVAIYCR
jgi:two-component system, chemotaxis family, chemotaxis protein CheY